MEPSAWGPLAVVDSSGSGEALIQGTIRISDGCVLLDERGEMVLLVWPIDRVDWNETTQVVSLSVADGVVELVDGVKVSMNGGGSSLSEGGQSGEAFLSSVDWVSRPAPECVTDTRWFVGSEASIRAAELVANGTVDPAEVVEPLGCDYGASCLAGFLLNEVFYSLSCTAIGESSVTGDVIGSGILYAGA